MTRRRRHRAIGPLATRGSMAIRMPAQRRHGATPLGKGFLAAGHLPTLFAAFLYFDLSVMVWVLLGPLGVAIAAGLHLNPAAKGLMVGLPVLAGAFLRVVLGVLVDRYHARRVGIGAQKSSTLIL